MAFFGSQIVQHDVESMVAAILGVCLVLLSTAKLKALLVPC